MGKFINKLPPIETNSFYIPYKTQGTRIEDWDMDEVERELATYYIDYVFDDDGNCRMISRPYDEDV